METQLETQIPQERNSTRLERLGEELAQQGESNFVPRDPKGRFGAGNQAGKGRVGIDALVRQAARAEGLNNIRKLVDLRNDSKSEKIQLAATQTLHYIGFGRPREAKENEDSADTASDIALDQDTLGALMNTTK